jgi:hypothetical protein
VVHSYLHTKLIIIQVLDSSSWLERFEHAIKFLDSPLAQTPCEPVKVAILDTGCDISDQYFAGDGNGRVDEIETYWKDYVNESTKPVDEYKLRHGTALAALALRLMPHAQVHILRVARDHDELSVSAERIADVCLRTMRQ